MILFVFFLYGLSASFLLFLLPVLRVVRLCGTPGCIAAYVGIFLEILQLSGLLRLPDSISVLLLYSKDSHEGTCCYSSTDNTCYVGSHCMHQ